MGLGRQGGARLVRAQGFTGIGLAAVLTVGEGEWPGQTQETGLPSSGNERGLDRAVVVEKGGGGQILNISRR